MDPHSLHKCRQVCQDCNTFILKEVWGSKTGREEIMRKLKLRLRRWEPSVSELPGVNQLNIERVVVDNRSVGVGSCNTECGHTGCGGLSSMF